MTAPTLRIVGGGEPTEEELAALVAVIAVVQARSVPDETSASASRWQRSARPMPPAHGRDGWLTTARHSSLRGGR